MTPGTEQRKLAAIMFTDMVGYSALAQRNEALALELLGEQQRLLRPLFPKFNGREIKSTGDGFLVEFASALEAAQCAIEIQKAVAAHNATESPERHLQLRIGLHLGDVVLREADMFGDGVNIAARIEPLAEAGGICLSGPVRDQVANKLGVALVKLGAPELKNIQTAVDVYRVVLPWQGSGTAVRPSTTKPRSLPTARTLLFAGTAGLVLLGVGWWMVYPRAAGRITSLAVKPLDDFSGNTNNAYLSDGMTEALCNNLGSISALRVPGRASVMRYKGGQKSIREIAKDLGVDAIVEGSVQRNDNRIRVTVQLIEAATDRQLWGKSFNRDLSEFFVLQDEVARAIAAEVQVRLTPEDQARLARARTAKPEAIEAYLRGMQYWWQWSDESTTNALRYFGRAIEIEPEYAPAHAGLALAYMAAGTWVGAMSAQEAAPKGKAAAESAIQLDPMLVEAYVARGYVRINFDWDWAGAEQDFKRALELNPHSVTALDGYAAVLVPCRRDDEALVFLNNALKLDPLSAALRNDLGWAHWVAGQFDRAIPHLDKALETDRNFHSARRMRGWSYFFLGNTNQALADFTKAVELDRASPWNLAALGWFHGMTGRRTEAMQLLAELNELAQRRYVPPCVPAQVYIGLGQTNTALEWLKKASEERDGWLLGSVAEPQFASLRDEPRFQALRKKLGYVK